MATRTNSITNTDGTGGPTLPNGLTIGTAHMPAVVGTAPIYACRAWVNFNGTGTVAIRASGNVSSITDNGDGLYVVNFTTAMPDSNYAALCSVNSSTIAAAVATKTTATTTSCGVSTTNNTAYADFSEVSVAIFC